MSSAASGGSARIAERILAVAIFALALYQLYLSSKVGVTPRGTPAREALQHMHVSLGLTILFLLLPRLWLKWRLPREPRPARVPASADAFARWCTTGFLATLLLLCLSGPVFAWSEAHKVSWFGILNFPDLVAASYRVQVALGYLHSVFGFVIFYLAGLCVVTALWQMVRYRVSPQRMLPGFAWSAASEGHTPGPGYAK